MNSPASKKSRLTAFRQRAEELLHSQPCEFVASIEGGECALQRELQVQQIQLDMVIDELVLSEQRARLAIEASNAAMWDYDVSTGEVYLSEAWAVFLGGKRKPTRTTILDLEGLVPEEQRHKLRSTFLRVIENKKSSKFRMNHCVAKPDGDSIWVHSRGSVVERDLQGQARRMIGVVFDITERIQAEARLIESEKRFRALFESAGDYALVLELQASGKPIIVDGNRAFFDKHGYTRKELIGQSVAMIETSDAAVLIDERVKRLMSGRTLCFEVEHRCKDGSTFIAEVVAKLVQDGVGLVYAVERDISEQLQAEEEKNRLFAENRRLLQQLITLQEDERRSLARDLHDELGQMLTSINIRAEYIAKHAIHDDVREMAKEIIRDTNASFAASRATLSRLRPATLDALGLEAALTELAGKAAKKLAINCSLRIEGKIDQADDMHAITIFRLVQEALTNARRHGRADQVEVIVKHMPLHEGRDCIRVEISDNGKGSKDPKSSQGMGIIGMRERVHALGGTFSFTHASPGGARIEAVLPQNGEGGG